MTASCYINEAITAHARCSFPKSRITKCHSHGNGGEIRFNTPAQQLIQDESGKVTGVIATDADGKSIQINADKGAIIYTGGYGANTEMLNDLAEGNTKWRGMTLCPSEAKSLR